MSAETTPRLLEHLLATDGEALGDLSTWLHDADAQVNAISWDPITRALIVPFTQEPFGVGGLAPRRVRRTWLYDEYELPLLACRLIVHGAGRPRSRDPLDGVNWATLLGLGHYEAIAALRIDFGDGGWLEVPVRSLFVELEVSDVVVTLARRRVGRWIPFSSTSYRDRRGQGRGGFDERV